MRKLKLYLDSSVISHLFAEDTPDKMADTIRLWNECINGKYDIYISEVVTNEIRQCQEPKLSNMLEKMRLIDFQVLQETDEIKTLAAEYVKGGVLKEKSLADCFHIAYTL